MALGVHLKHPQKRSLVQKKRALLAGVQQEDDWAMASAALTSASRWRRVFSGKHSPHKKE